MTPLGRAVLGAGLALVAGAGAGCDGRGVRGGGADAGPLDEALALGRPAAPRPNDPVRLLVAGDVIPHAPVLADGARVGEALGPLGALFRGADRTLVNFEGGIVPDGRPLDREAMVHVARGDLFGALARAGVGVVTVANNHVCDAGEAGLGAALAAGARAGVDVLGVDDDDAWEPRVVAKKGDTTICAVAFTELVNARDARCTSSPRLARLAQGGPKARARRVELALERAASRCTATVAVGHLGEEYEAQTSRALALARAAAEAGAAAVVLHHPHVPSPVLTVTTRDGRTVPVFASVGNLVSNQGGSWQLADPPVPAAGGKRPVSKNAWTRLGVVADLTFTRAAGGGATAGGAARVDVAWSTHLTWTEQLGTTSLGDDAKVRVRLVDPAADARLLDRLRSRPAPGRPLLDDPCWVEASGHGCVAAAPSETPRAASTDGARPPSARRAPGPR